MQQRKVYFVVSILLLVMIGMIHARGNNNEKYYYGHMQRGYGHMGRGGYGSGYGMMGYRNGSPQFNNTGERLSNNEVSKILDEYVTYAFGNDYYIKEIMEFQRNFYAQIGENGEDHLAVELLIDPYTGQIFPEHGPNMMWNRSYGHMGRRFSRSGKVKISESEAIEVAQEFLDYNNTGMSADTHVATFDGYYTLHTLDDGHINGMLSVNSVTGDVWFHDWHGVFRGDESEDGHEESETHKD